MGLSQTRSEGTDDSSGSDLVWVPLLSRPGTCAGDGAAADYKSSVQFPDETLTFIKSYPLMDEAVPSVNERPCFTRTSSRSSSVMDAPQGSFSRITDARFGSRRSKLTQIVVDVSAGPNKNRTVMFLGSEDGRILKVLPHTHPNNSVGTELLEDIDVYNPSK